MAKKKTLRNAPVRTNFIDDTILRNGFSFGNDIYIEYAFDLTSREFSAVVKNRREDFELTGTMTMTEPEAVTEETTEGTTEGDRQL